MLQVGPRTGRRFCCESHRRGYKPWTPQDTMSRMHRFTISAFRWRAKGSACSTLHEEIRPVKCEDD